MAKITIPVTWECFALMQVDYTPGESLETMIERALASPLPNGDSIQDSLQLDYDGIALQNQNQSHVLHDFPLLQKELEER
jgi:hypothetical protein